MSPVNKTIFTTFRTLNPTGVEILFALQAIDYAQCNGKKIAAKSGTTNAMEKGLSFSNPWPMRIYRLF